MVLVAFESPPPELDKDEVAAVEVEEEDVEVDEDIMLVMRPAVSRWWWSTLISSNSSGQKSLWQIVLVVVNQEADPIKLVGQLIQTI